MRHESEKRWRGRAGVRMGKGYDQVSRSAENRSSRSRRGRSERKRKKGVLRGRGQSFCPSQPLETHSVRPLPPPRTSIGEEKARGFTTYHESKKEIRDVF
nr:hypothetical protein CFP56_56474 [Quercus suber]